MAKQKVPIEAWLNATGHSASELERAGVVSRKTITNIKQGKGWNVQTLRSIADYLGIRYEQLLSHPPEQRSVYTLKEWLRDPHPLLDTHVEATEEQRAVISAILEPYLRQRRSLKRKERGPRSRRGLQRQTRVRQRRSTSRAK